MVESGLHALLIQTLALSVAVVAVRILQSALARRLGAGAAYLLWLLVPVAMLAVALPHPATDALVIRVDLGATVPPWVSSPVARSVANGRGMPAVVGVVWVLGALSLGALLVRHQRGFEALVAPPFAGCTPCLPAGAGPAVLGIWRRRIVLPRDFDTAFDSDERRLMLAHEGVHLRRADNAWNLLASALLVAHWFNPIAWWAWRGMRVDQELSCDAAVLRQEPAHALAVYAKALLKVQGVALVPPLATSWQSAHPLVERVRMLQLHRFSSARHRVGLRIAALCILLAGTGGYGLRAGASAVPEAVVGGKTSVLMSVHAEYDGQRLSRATLKLLTRAGEKSTLRGEGDAAKNIQASEITFTAIPLPGERVQIDAELRYGDSLVGSPRVITHDREPARLEVKSVDGGHVFSVTLLPRLVKPLPTPSSPSAPPQRAL